MLTPPRPSISLVKAGYNFLYFKEHLSHTIGPSLYPMADNRGGGINTDRGFRGGSIRGGSSRGGTSRGGSNRGGTNRGGRGDGTGTGRGGRSDSAPRADNGRPTHFLCIPLVTRGSRPQLEQSMTRFQRTIRDHNSKVPATSPAARGGRPDGNFRGPQQPAKRVPEAAIRPIGSIHLTLGVMFLTSPEKIEEAIVLLNKSSSIPLTSEDRAFTSRGPGPSPRGAATNPFDTVVGEVRSGIQSLARDISRPLPSTIRDKVHDTVGAGNTTSHAKDRADDHDRVKSHGNSPLKVDLKSLVSMHPAERTTILYAQPDDASGRLLRTCQRLRDIFINAGLVQNDRGLKLHATVVNTVYAKGRGRGKAPLIDATDLVEQFKDYNWAEGVVLDKIAICKMGAKQVMDNSGKVVDERYEELATAPFPVL